MATPVTAPVAFTAAIRLLLLYQEPPVAASVSGVVPPEQRVVTPEIVPAVGVVFTVTTCVATALPQTFVTVYEIAVVPVASPVTSPAVPIVATAGDAELQDPPGAASVTAAVAPEHSTVLPVIVPATGKAFTVTIRVAVALPQLLVTV